MVYEQRAYDDLDSTGQMVLDCTACGERVDLRQRRRELRLDFDALAGVPPWGKTKREIELAEAAAHLAARLHLT